MRTIERTNQLKRDYKRELKGQHRATLEDDFREVLKLLVTDQPLPERYHDHALTGNWREFVKKPMDQGQYDNHIQQIKY